MIKNTFGFLASQPIYKSLRDMHIVEVIIIAGFGWQVYECHLLLKDHITNPNFNSGAMSALLGFTAPISTAAVISIIQTNKKQEETK